MRYSSDVMGTVFYVRGDKRTTVIDPSLPLRMTPCRPLSFWTESRKPWGKGGKRNSNTEWRIYYADDTLPAFSLRQQIFHVRFGWRLTFPSLWRFAVRRHSALLADSCRLTAFSSQLIAFIFLPAFLTIAADSSLTLWMTAYRFPHHGYRFFAAAQDDVLWSSSSRVQILHIRFGWRFAVSCQ